MSIDLSKFSGTSFPLENNSWPYLNRVSGLGAKGIEPMALLSLAFLGLAFLGLGIAPAEKKPIKSRVKEIKSIFFMAIISYSLNS